MAVERGAERRIGGTDSASRVRLLDGAERLLLDEGYAAVTSRRVAAAAGLKHQLVHYYFRTMDDLFLEVFRRRAEQRLESFGRALDDEPSLRTIWAFTSDPRGAAFTVEFAALSNHRKAIRAEVAAYADRFRTMQLAAIQRVLAERGVDSERYPPVVVLMALTGIAQLTALDTALGVTTGLEETAAYVEQLVDEIERPIAP
jgi:AcrR family transcriptional regulator